MFSKVNNLVEIDSWKSVEVCQAELAKATEAQVEEIIRNGQRKSK